LLLLLLLLLLNAIVRYYHLSGLCLLKSIAHIQCAGMSCRELGCLFGCDHREVARRIRRTREILCASEFIGSNFGFSSVSAQKIKENTTAVARGIFGDKPIVILDGNENHFVSFHFIDYFAYHFISFFNYCFSQELTSKFRKRSTITPSSAFPTLIKKNTI
jgi:hypothetical protein